MKPEKPNVHEICAMFDLASKMDGDDVFCVYVAFQAAATAGWNWEDDETFTPWALHATHKELVAEGKRRFLASLNR